MLGPRILSAFAVDPASVLPADIPSNELWEHLNPQFHIAFGYNASLDTRVSIVERGSSGLDGFITFLRYFSDVRGLGDIVEAKIEQMDEAVRRVCVLIFNPDLLAHWCAV